MHCLVFDITAYAAAIWPTAGIRMSTVVPYVAGIRMSTVVPYVAGIRMSTVVPYVAVALVNAFTEAHFPRARSVAEAVVGESAAEFVCWYACCTCLAHLAVIRAASCTPPHNGQLVSILCHIPAKRFGLSGFVHVQHGSLATS